MSPRISQDALILLLDTDVDRRAETSVRLTEEGFQVLEAGTVDEAVEHAGCEFPEAALIDARLVEDPNAHRLTALGEDESGETLPWLALVDDVSQVPAALRAGALDWIQRPLSGAGYRLRVDAALELREQAADGDRLRAAIDVLERMGQMGAWRFDPATGELFGSEISTRLLGLPNAEGPFSLDAILDVVHPEQQGEVRTWLEEISTGNDVASIEFELGAHDGTPRKVRMRSSFAQAGKPVSGIVQDCTPGIVPTETTELVNTSDPLTGLPNRKQFLHTLDRAIIEAQEKNEQIAILFIEVDASRSDDAPLLKAEREELLVFVVQRLRDELRGFDVLAQSGLDLSLSRVGNETLTVLLREQTRSQDAFKVSRRIRETTERSFVIDGQDVLVNFNIGIAIYPGDAESPLGLVKCAEEAMYCAKQQGRNNIQFYTSSMNTATFETLTLESSLRRALEKNELLVYYQPKVEIATNRIVGMEALVRWKHPELGLVSPAQFIPVAEETGLIIPIGDFVLRTACAQNKAWQDAGLDPIRMAVNISSIQFRRPDLFDNVVGVLDEARLDSDWLELEITESILLKNVDATISTLNQLKRAGIHLSIDDFGTGYSSLSYLKRFPIDTLKIDQSFIREVTSNADDASITTSIILMGHSLKLKVIAEGVETKSQLAFLRVLECDEVQGYYFSAPVPAEEATALLESAVVKSDS